MSLIQFPSRSKMTECRYPAPASALPATDAGLARVQDLRDRAVWDTKTVDVVDDHTDEFMTMDVRLGAHYGEPTIELGRYSLPLSDARKLADIILHFASQVRDVD